MEEEKRPVGRPKNSKNKNGYTHSIKSLVQRQKAPTKSGKFSKLKQDFLIVPKDKEGNPLISEERMRELYQSNVEDYACEPVVALMKLGASVQTLLDIQQMVDAEKGEVLSKPILDGVRVVADLAKTLAKMKYGEHKRVTVEHKMDKNWDDEDLEIEVSTDE